MWGYIFMKIEKILLPVDGSKNSEKAIDYALTIAEDEDSEIIILNAVDSKRMTSLPEDALEQEHELVFEQEGRRVTENIKDILLERSNCPEKIKIRLLTLEGNPAALIKKVSQDEDVDMVIMVSSGKHFVDRLLLGSVTEKTVRQSPVPVLVIPAEE